MMTDVDRKIIEQALDLIVWINEKNDDAEQNCAVMAYAIGCMMAANGTPRARVKELCKAIMSQTDYSRKILKMMDSLTTETVQ